MLRALIFINKNIIDTVNMRNVGASSKLDGKFQYKCWLESAPEKIKYVWHKREDGWAPLVVKAIKAVSK